MENPDASPRPAEADKVDTQAPTLPERGGIGAVGGWRYTPHAIVFCSSACIMVVELVAGRLIARHLGSSLYTWTSIIGVVLAGMSVGNYIGGRMADRWKPEDFLGWLFMLASAACVSTLFLNEFFSTQRPLDSFSWPLRVFGSVVLIFLLPALVLGTISPATAKMALDRCRNVGATIGSVYAWGTVGSILGTLTTGFFLISTLGSKGVVLAVSLGLALIGTCLGPQRWLQAAWAALLALGLVLSRLHPAPPPLPVVGELPPPPSLYQRLAELGRSLQLQDGAGYRYHEDSDYQYIKVHDLPSKHDPKRQVAVLVLDSLRHGFVDPKDPAHLEYEYEHIYRDLTRRWAQGRQKPSFFFLGGGSYTFPRWANHEWPGSVVDVAEIDPAVLKANHQALDLPDDTPIRSYIGDARIVVDELPADRRYDLVFGDAFNDFSIPFHLTTLEFLRNVEKHMAPDGLLLANVIDCYEVGLFLGSYAATMRQVFKHVYIFCTTKEGVSSVRETFVIAASNVPLETSDWRPGHKTDFAGSVLTEENYKELDRKCGGRILTDDDAPVENLIAPVVRLKR